MSKPDSNLKHTLAKLGERMVEIIQDMCNRPHCYAATAIKVDTTFRNCHWFWATIYQRELDLDGVLQEAMPPGRRSITGSFSRLFDFEFPNGAEGERVAFVCRKWKDVSTALGIV
jgi:hypothetical protein